MPERPLYLKLLRDAMRNVIENGYTREGMQIECHFEAYTLLDVKFPSQSVVPYLVLLQIDPACNDMPTKIISSTMRSIMIPRLRNATGRTQLAHSSHTFDVQHERRGTHLSAVTMGRRASKTMDATQRSHVKQRAHTHAGPWSTSGMGGHERRERQAREGLEWRARTAVGARPRGV